MNIFFFLIDNTHNKGQRPPSIQEVYKSASKREHKKKEAPLPSLKWLLATPKNLRVKRTPLQYTP